MTTAQLSALPAAVSESELAGLSLYFASNYLVALAYGMLWVGLLEALRQGLPRAGGQLLVAFALMQLVLSEAMLALDLPLWIAAGMLPLDVWAFMACTLGAMALVPLAWSFRLFNGPASRLVLNLFLGLVVFAIALRLSFAAEFMSPAAYATGAVVGILRILSLLVAGYAILRTDFLPTKLASTTARRGSLAGLALAALFITAQVLQNLLGDRLGLLWGGVVAGAVVFASFPLQRAAERRLGTGTKAEDSFRAAVRLALRDSKLTPEEERDLVVLAHQLGLPPDRAYAILQDEGRGPAKPGAAPSH